MNLAYHSPNYDVSNGARFDQYNVQTDASPAISTITNPPCIESSVLACMTLLSLGRHQVMCDQSAVQVRADEAGQRSIFISLPFVSQDILQDGERISRCVWHDLAAIAQPLSVRVKFAEQC